MKIRSAVPENGCIIFLAYGKKQKQKKTSVKHIRYRLIGGCVNDWSVTMLVVVILLSDAEYTESDADRPAAKSLKPAVTYSPLRSSVTNNPRQLENSLGHGFNYAGLHRLRIQI